MASADNKLKVLNLLESKEEFTLHSYNDTIKSVAFSLDGEFVIVGLKKNQAHLCKFNDRLKEYGLESAKVQRNLFEQDSKLLLSPLFASFQDFIQFYNILYSLKTKQFNKLSSNSSGILLTKHSYTYTHFLCYYGQSKVLQQLITPNFVIRADSFGHSPLYYSILNNDQSCTDVLLEFLINLSKSNNHSLYITSFHALKKDFKLIIKNSSKKLPEFLSALMYSSTFEILGAYSSFNF